MTLEQAKTIFSKEFLQQLEIMRISGNFGDIVMNPQGTDIVEYFTNSNPKLEIIVHTNGSARRPEFWKKLAELDAHVNFGIDGLEDTHSLYRQNTRWDRVIENAGIFIDAGGRAEWHMIKFKHNMHQVDACKAMAKQMGFIDFKLQDQGRDTGPVFNKQGELIHVLGDYTGETDFQTLKWQKDNDDILLEDILPGTKPCSAVKCKAVDWQGIYVSANGEVSPCCWTGLYPKTFGKGQWLQAVNTQLIPLIKENNALHYPLEQCIKWFKEIEKSWQIDKYENGRLVMCDHICGDNSKYQKIEKSWKMEKDENGKLVMCDDICKDNSDYHP
jgi:sulfatase maturation enzyme AslB (radical SAM superfamily)